MTKSDESAAIDATPAAQDHADATGVDLGAVAGTGASGTILKSDVTAAIEAGNELVTVTYGGPSGTLLADGYSCPQGGTAHWPRSVAQRVAELLPEHSLVIVPDAAKDDPRGTTETGSVASDSAHLINEIPAPPE